MARTEVLATSQSVLETNSPLWNMGAYLKWRGIPVILRFVTSGRRVHYFYANAP